MSVKEARAATEAEKVQKQRRDERAEELEAMRAAFSAIDKLPEVAQRRVMDWLRDALRPSVYDDEPPF